MNNADFKKSYHSLKKIMFSPIQQEGFLSGIIVVEADPIARQHIVRKLTAITGLVHIEQVDDFAQVPDLLGSHSKLIALRDTDIQFALAYAEQLPEMQLMIWSHEPSKQLLEQMRDYPQIFSHLLAWPSFMTMPRAWELSLATRDILMPSYTRSRLADIMHGGASLMEWAPSESTAIESVTSEVTNLAQRAGASKRLSQSISETCYEMLMNAMYDAPVNLTGEPLYAFDRRQAITLNDNEIPKLRFATNGNFIALEITDSFGLLSRNHVLNGIIRGMSANNTSNIDQVLDTTSGGAGLGIFRMYGSCASLIFHVEQEVQTRVTAVFDLRLKARELRLLPTSLHCTFNQSDNPLNH